MTVLPSRTALVVRGGWPGHSPVEATELFRPFLTANGFEVKVAESTAVYEDSHLLASTDLILQCVSMGSITEEGVAGLRNAVAAGTGLVGWHGGIVDSYRDRPEYLQLVGGQFVAHPGHSSNNSDKPASDDNFVPHRINIERHGSSDIVGGSADFDLVTEQYWVLTDAYNDVLATTTQQIRPGDPWLREITCPAVWTRLWGRGRVFVATPGHDLEVLRHPDVRRIIEAGLLWVARPADQPA